MFSDAAPWRQTPPALFPPILGVLGLGMAWRAAGPGLGLEFAVGDLILGAGVLLLLVAGAAYLAKLVARPSVLPEDLMQPPARAGLAAASMGAMVAAAAAVVYWPGPAMLGLAVAVAVHIAIVILVVRAIRRSPAPARRFMPGLHLPFVGLVLAPLTLIPLGAETLSAVVMIGSLLVAGVLWALGVKQVIRDDLPMPLRPMLAIHLAPLSIIGIVAGGLGFQMLEMGLVYAALILVTALFLFLPWVIEGGFGATWGAFTFPLAAFSTQQLLFHQHQISTLSHTVGTLALIAATCLIPWITIRIFIDWRTGALARKSGTAIA